MPGPDGTSLSGPEHTGPERWALCGCGRGHFCSQPGSVVLSREDIRAVRNLVARLNGDGGHRQVEVGMAQAAEEAEKRVVVLMQREAEGVSVSRAAVEAVREVARVLASNSGTSGWKLLCAQLHARLRTEWLDLDACAHDWRDDVGWVTDTCRKCGETR